MRHRGARAGYVTIPLPPPARGSAPSSVILSSQEGTDGVAAAFAAGWLGFEPPLPDLFVRAVRLRPGWVLDVGANTGAYSLIAAAAARHLRVHAFEPLPPVAELLRANIRRNACRRRIEVHQVGVGAQDGPATLFLPPSCGSVETSASLDPTFKEAVAETIPIHTTTLDRFWAERGRPPVTVVKIDVEGTEVGVLQGAGELVASARPFVFHELLPRADVGFLQRFASEHDLVDVRLRRIEAVVGEPPVFDPDAWNHAFVPRERIEELVAIAAASNLRVTRRGG